MIRFYLGEFMDELERLKAILKNSFAAIKRDMDELKEFRNQQLRGSFELKQDFDKVKEEYVTKDRLNLLKIKIGEINDSLKKLWDIEEEIKQLDNKTVSKSLFDQRMQEFSSESDKKLADIKVSIAQLREDAKQFVSKKQIKDLITDINDEFNIIHKELADVKKKRDIATAREVKSRADELNKKIELLAKELVDTNKKVSTMIRKEQVENLVKQIDEELDDIKTDMSEIQKVKKYVSLVESDAVKHKDLKNETKDLEDDINDLRDELSELKNELKGEFKKAVKGVKREEVIVKEEKKAKFKPKNELEQKKPYRTTMFIGNFFIGIAFALIIAAIIAFFAVEPAWADTLSITAVISFVLGIILRVIVIMKRK